MTFFLSSTLYSGPQLFPLLPLPYWDISNFAHLLYVAVPSRCLGYIYFSQLFCCIWTYWFFPLHHYQGCHYSKAKLMIYSWLWFIGFWAFFRPLFLKACAGAVVPCSLPSWLTGSQQRIFLQNCRARLSWATSQATSWVVNYWGGESREQRQEAAITASEHLVSPGDTWFSKFEGSE